MTLYTVLKSLCLISAPFIPFMTEEIYQNIVRSVDTTAPDSIHLCDWPAVDESYIDKDLEAHMDEVLSVVVLGRSARNTAAIKNRQPIPAMHVQGEELPAMFTSIISEELNVKLVEYVSDASSFISYRVKPQLKTLGPRYGKLLPKINAYLAEDGIGDAVVAAHNEGHDYTFELDGVAVSLSPEDVLVSTGQKEGFVAEAGRDRSVALDIRLTPELIDEGFVRELVSKVQTMRKEAGFEVTDHILLTHSSSPKLADIFARFEADIAADTLADQVRAGEPAGYAKEWDINGEAVTLGVQKV